MGDCKDQKSHTMSFYIDLRELSFFFFFFICQQLLLFAGCNRSPDRVQEESKS